MSPEEWESLVSSPGWPKLKKYLRDFRARIMENMATGTVRGDKLTESILQCGLLKDLAEMDRKTIELFYKIETTYTEEPNNEP